MAGVDASVPCTYTLAMTPGGRNMLLSAFTRGLALYYAEVSVSEVSRKLKCTNLVGIPFLGSKNLLGEKKKV